MRRKTFDTNHVAAAGLRVSRSGWSAVSFRSVANELGVSAMALYRVAPDAEHLRRLVADGAATSIRPVDHDDFAETLSSWAHRAYTQLIRYPGLAAYVSAEWTDLPQWLDIVEALLRAAYRAGLEGEEAVASSNAVFAFVLARVQLREAAATKRRVLRAVTQNAARYPLLRANHGEYATCEADKHFGIGLNAIIVGLTATASNAGRRIGVAPESSR